MDPTACLRRIIEASRSVETREEYIAACSELAGWLAAGGFKPAVPAGLYIPGTGTPWSVRPHAVDTPAQLVRWSERGESLAHYDLED